MLTDKAEGPSEQWKGLKLGAGAGFEPASKETHLPGNQDSSADKLNASAQRGAQEAAAAWHELAFIADAWPTLRPELRSALLTIIKSTGKANNQHSSVTPKLLA